MAAVSAPRVRAAVVLVVVVVVVAAAVVVVAVVAAVVLQTPTRERLRIRPTHSHERPWFEVWVVPFEAQYHCPVPDWEHCC